MWHKADHISLRVRNAGYAVQRPVWVVAIPEHHAIFRPELTQRLFVAGVAALEMIDRDQKASSHFDTGGENAPVSADFDLDRFADESESAVLLESARQHPGLCQHLKSVADPDNGAPIA